MLKSSIESLEGKKSIAILIAGIAGIYYILKQKNPELPPMDDLLKHVGSVAELSKYYAGLEASGSISSPQNGAYDFGTIGAIIFGMYKVYSKFTDSRTNLKIADIKATIDNTK